MKIGYNIDPSHYIDVPVMQLFTHSTNPYGQVLTDAEIQKLTKTGKPIYVHSTFNVVIGKFFARKPFMEQYKLAEKHKLWGLIVHIPNIPVEEVIAGFKKLAHKDTMTRRVIVYIEHVPGEYGASTMLLKQLYDGLVRAYPKYKFGICIDTCHIYSSGINIGDKAVMKKYLDEIEEFNAPIFVHLNDSEGELGSLIDRHGVIGTRIWTPENHSALKLLLAKPWNAVIELRDVAKVEASLNFIKKIENNT